MVPISVAMIARNEEKKLPQTLESLGWVDQIVFIDCESSDNTAKIAAKAGTEVYHEPNRQNLNINKNIALQKCRNDWVLVLDADEEVSLELADEISRIVEHPECSGYYIPRRNQILGRWVKHGGQYPDLQLRLVRKSAARFPEKHIHERMQIDGKLGRLSQPLHHYTYLTLSEMIHKGLFNTEFEAFYLSERVERFDACTLFTNVLIRPWARFLRRYIFRGGFLDGVPGLAIAFMDALNNVLRWLRAWEIRTRAETGEPIDLKVRYTSTKNGR